jgi:hypothetical protein
MNRLIFLFLALFIASSLAAYEFSSIDYLRDTPGDFVIYKSDSKDIKVFAVMKTAKDYLINLEKGDGKIAKLQVKLRITETTLETYDELSQAKDYDEKTVIEAIGLFLRFMEIRKNLGELEKNFPTPIMRNDESGTAYAFSAWIPIFNLSFIKKPGVTGNFLYAEAIGRIVNLQDLGVFWNYSAKPAAKANAAYSFPKTKEKKFTLNGATLNLDENWKIVNNQFIGLYKDKQLVADIFITDTDMNQGGFSSILSYIKSQILTSDAFINPSSILVTNELDGWVLSYDSISKMNTVKNMIAFVPMGSGRYKTVMLRVLKESFDKNEKYFQTALY